MEYVKYDSDQRLELRKNLERLRLRYNLSKQELADDLGYSKKQLRKSRIVGGNRMRPNRYPYTKSQWTEEDYVSYTNMYGEHIALKILKNRITGEQK